MEKWPSLVSRKGLANGISGSIICDETIETRGQKKMAVLGTAKTVKTIATIFHSKGIFAKNLLMAVFGWPDCLPCCLWILVSFLDLFTDSVVTMRLSILDTGLTVLPTSKYGVLF